jgi:hypothetical protein
MGPHLKIFFPAQKLRSLALALFLSISFYILYINYRVMDNVIWTLKKTKYTFKIIYYTFQFAREMESGSGSCLA